jgi:hypothetical protein
VDQRINTRLFLRWTPWAECMPPRKVGEGQFLAVPEAAVPASLQHFLAGNDVVVSIFLSKAFFSRPPRLHQPVNGEEL